MSLVKELETLPADLQYLVSNFGNYVDLNNEFYFALACIAFNPIFWNIVARLEYRTHFLTKISGGARNGCYLLAVIIFGLGIYRDHVYHDALLLQPTYQPLIDSVIIKSLAVFTFGFGNVLVLTSMYALGVTGTYLGDYFGILMDERVTGFPFNINDNPMYNGSTLCFLGTALWYGKPAGISVAAVVFIMYKIALLFEEPFTAKIYAAREENKKDV
ncbi:Phosphatidyl-N-methylethanolamine N-methyltransferase [Spathaspora sp. JA1]|nr:Phosphatidyl-N-methylethanolamine N-methyltransferase [Spathaspora sp. JA1]